MPHGLAQPGNITVAPSVWVLTGNNASDNSLVLALAEALGWPFEIKQFVYRAHELVANLLLRTTIAGIDQQQSSPIEAPWPDLVISAGHRNEPIARWIKQQSPDIRLVHVGRPWSSLDCFDLVVATQHRMPTRANLLHNKSARHRVAKDRLDNEATRWRDRLAHLPRPLTAVIVGGSSGRCSFDRRAAERLTAEVSAFVAERGGSLLIATSARTPLSMVEILEQDLRVPKHLFRWSTAAKENPYLAFLGLADSIIVTGDSMPMFEEACATRKPVYIFDLCQDEGAMCPKAASVARRAEAGQRRFGKARLGAFLYRFMMKFGPGRSSHDIRTVHDHLVHTGQAAWRVKPFDPARSLPAAVVRIHTLMHATPTRGVAAHARLDELMPLRRSA